ncbi:MAG: SpoIID/LytB domain-containing protein [Clostridiaceae bacterium]|nr:SpoIID/LytB domain-containing protein [Clostridiaceae bacterium]
MKKLFILLIILLSILSIGGIYCLYPHKVEHAILLESNEEFSSIYLEGKKVKLNVSKVNYPVFTVFNYKYNLFRVYDLTMVKTSVDRVMVKEAKSYELESQGNISLSKKAFYYRMNKTTLEPCTSKDLIVGKSNVKSFLNNSGNLMTFIISPIDYTNIRVGISTNKFSSLYHDKLQLISASKLKLYSLLKKTSEEVPENTLIEIDKTPQGVRATIKGKTSVYIDRLYLNGGSIKILNLKRGTPEYVPEYSGTLEFSFSAKGICVTNELSVEDYLTKVVPSEMPNSGGLESLKCQAVAARTYAISDMLSNRFGNLGFYVDDSTKSQVYNNSVANTLSNTAIDSTSGLIMSFNNTPIDAKFFSTSCGTGARYEDVWFKPDGSSDSRPYFRTVNFVSATLNILPKDEVSWLNFYKNTSIPSIDSASSYFRWSMKVSLQQLSKALNKTLPSVYNKNKDYIVMTKDDKVVSTLPELGELKSFQVVKRSPGGNVMGIGLVFENINMVIQGESSIGTTLNFSKEFTGGDTSLLRLNSTAISNPSSLPSKFFAIEKSDDSYIIYGGGYGHGVGMSQYGAMDLSKKGWDFKKILNIYYKNINFTKLSYTDGNVSK